MRTSSPFWSLGGKAKLRQQHSWRYCSGLETESKLSMCLPGCTLTTVAELNRANYGKAAPVSATFVGCACTMLQLGLPLLCEHARCEAALVTQAHAPSVMWVLGFAAMGCQM